MSNGSNEKKNWPVPEIFQIIQKKGRISDRQMYRTFNMGIGLALVLRPKDATSVCAYFKRKRIRYYKIGEVINDSKRRIII